jgi:hypothetical protein
LSFAAAATHRLNGVPFSPDTCFLDSAAHAVAGGPAGWLRASAIAGAGAARTARTAVMTAGFPWSSMVVSS